MLCISTLEADFSLKQTHLGVVEQFITENDHCKDVHVHVKMVECSVDFQTHYSIIIARTI